MKTPIMAIVSSQEIPRSAHSLSLGVGAPQSDPAPPRLVHTCGVSEHCVSRGQVRHHSLHHDVACFIPVSPLCVVQEYGGCLCAALALGTVLPQTPAVLGCLRTQPTPACFTGNFAHHDSTPKTPCQTKHWFSSREDL